MSKIAKASSTTWQTFDGGLCAIIVGRDSIRREFSIAVPAAAFQVLAAEARRRLAAAKSEAERGPVISKFSLGPDDDSWHH